MSGMFNITNGWIIYHDHKVSVGYEYVNESSKVRVPHFHTLERGSQLAMGKRKMVVKEKTKISCPLLY